MDYGNNMEHFSLRWNNFNDNMKSGFHDLLRTEDFVDVTIAVEGKLIQAHKMVLSVCSPYFKNIFKTNPCQHPVVFLKDVTHKELSGILQFMYLGEVSIQQEELGRFLKTAEALQIKGLTRDNHEGKNETVYETLQSSYESHITNKTKQTNSDLSEKEICTKKVKLSSVSEMSQSKCQTPAQNEEKTDSIMENQNSAMFHKTEPPEIELSDSESDRITIIEGSASVSDSFLDVPDNNVDIRDDTNHSPVNANSSGLTQELISGIPGLTNDSFLVAVGNQGLGYFPLLTKNQGLCPICGRILQHKKNLQTHIADQHSGIFQSWPCQICHKICKTWSALRVHTNRHHTKLGSASVTDVSHSLN